MPFLVGRNFKMKQRGQHESLKSEKMGRDSIERYVGSRKKYLEIGIQSELVVLLLAHDPHLLVFPDTLLEEVGLPLQGDGLHEVEGVGSLVNLEQK